MPDEEQAKLLRSIFVSNGLLTPQGQKFFKMLNAFAALTDQEQENLKQMMGGNILETVHALHELEVEARDISFVSL